jgi:UPF0042 nucleotide-binding protein
MLEDIGFYCMDNIPAHLLDTIVRDFLQRPDESWDDLAVGIDARTIAPGLENLPETLKDLRSRGIACEIIFLQAEDEVLLKRYSESRRKHPLGGEHTSLRDAIAQERGLLGEVINSAELVIDTTRLSVYDLRDVIRRRVAVRETPELSILIESFGYKHGIPADADFVFDVRCLPNPYWHTDLRPHTGRDEPVIEWLESQPLVQKMYSDIHAFLEHWIPEYIDFNRSYLTVAIGCTGGQHRSVYIAEKLARELAAEYRQLHTRHNELPGT